MDLNATQIFITVVQSGSLSAAAGRLEIPLPTISRKIQILEKQLNVQLLERSRSGVKLTDAGTTLYEQALRGIELLEEAEQAVLNDQKNIKGRLRLSIPQTFEPWWNLLSEFQLAYPNIHLQIYSTDRRVDLIEDGIDVALRVGSIVHESMVAKPLFSYSHILVGSPKLLEKLGEPQNPDDLKKFPCGGWLSRIDGTNCWELGGQKIEPNLILTTNDYNHLCKRALAGDIITELPPFLATEYLKENKLVHLLQQYKFPKQQIQLVFPSHRHQSKVIRTYITFCENFIHNIFKL